MSVINTNISSMQAQSSVRTSGLNLSTAMERLSSGVRINSAKDDAAGLAISTRMTASIRGISAAIRNANDGISLTQTAEGSLAQIGDNLQRIRELAVQSANTGNNASDRAAMNNEAKQLVAEIDRVANNTTYNGIKLLDGSFQGQDLQVGAGNGSNDRIAISIDSAKSSALGVGSNSSYAASTVGAAVGSTALAASALNINGYTTGAAADDGVSYTLPATSGIAVAAAINAISANTKVTATVGETSVAGVAVTNFSTVVDDGDVMVNGVSIGAIAAASTAAGRGGQVAAAVNAISSQTGVTATFNTTTGAVALNAADGRNITVTSTLGTAATGLASGVTSSMVGATSTSTAAVTGLTINGVAIDSVTVDPTKTTSTQPTVAQTRAGVVAQTQQSTVTFQDLAAGATVTVGGLTFTAGTNGALASEQAAAFATVVSGATHTAAITAAGSNVSATIGTFTSGTFVSTGAMGAGGVFTATTASDTQIALAVANTGSGTAVAVDNATRAGLAAVTEQMTVTFQDLAAGATVTVGGLTFTAGTNGALASEQAAAFATVVSGATHTAAITAAGSNVSATIGTFTSGTFVTTGAMGAGGVFTASTASVTSVALTAAAKETSVITFSNLAAGQKATVNGLTFTATNAMASTAVAAAFASLTSGMTAATATSTNTVSAALGTYSGTFTAGFTTGAVSGSTVTAYSDSTGGVTDIAITANKFDNLAIAINAKSSTTGVTAVNTSGSVALTSTGGLDLTGNTASVTGISGTVVTVDTNKTVTTRSKVTLSTTDSGGINVSGSTSAALTAAGLSEGAATVTATAGAGVSSIDLTTATGSQAALTTLDSAINTITDSRAAMGAYQNRLTASISNLETTSMNLSASRSRILDTDYAKETTNLAKSQIIQQAATAMLAQANQSGQSVLALLK